MNKKNISINNDLYDKIAERAKLADFTSVDEYVTYMLEQLIKDDISDIPIENSNIEEETEIKKRLKSLGYME